MSRRIGPDGASASAAAQERAAKLVQRLFDRWRRDYEEKLQRLQNERDLYRCAAADLQSQLDRQRARDRGEVKANVNEPI